MKTSQLLTGIVSLVSLCSLNFVTPQTSQASTRMKFYCGQDNDGTPTTFIKTIHNDKAFIRWERWLGGYSPQDRCEEVSSKFQRANENGTLELIYNGFWNNQRAICTATQPGSSCIDLLMTLRSTDNSERILNDLKDLVGFARQVGPIRHSGGEAHIYYLIDWEAFSQSE